MINKAILLGRLGADPKQKETKYTIECCEFDIATNEYYKDEAGKSHEITLWHRVVTYGDLASRCLTYLSKGKEVYVEGRNVPKRWQTADGRRMYSYSIVARDVKFLGGTKRESEPSSTPLSKENQAKPKNLVSDEVF